MTLVEFYKGILESLSLTVDSAGGVHKQFITGQNEPYYISGKHLVLPTPERLRAPDWENTIAFHPLSENIARKNSPVFNELQRLANLSCNVDIGTLMYTLVELCADKDKHKTMNHRQTAFLQLFPDADEISLKNFDKIESKNNGENSYVKIITTRDSKLNGQTYPRVSKVKFPFYEDIVKQMESKQKEYHLFGVKVRKKDIRGYRALFEYIITNCATPDEHYSFGSRNHIAPSFHALMTATNRIKIDTRKVFLLLKYDVPEVHWGKELENLQQWKGHVPPLQGNEGELTEGEKRNNQLQAQQPAPVIAPAVAPPPAAPVVAPTPVIAPAVTPVTAQAPVVTAPVAQPIQPNVAPANNGQRKVIPFKSPYAPQQPMQQQGYPQPQQPMNGYGMQPTQMVQPMMVPQMPGQPMIPAVPGQPQMGYMNQQRPVDAYGRPLPTNLGSVNNLVPVNQMGQPMMPMNGYAMYPQTNAGWGYR